MAIKLTNKDIRPEGVKFSDPTPQFGPPPPPPEVLTESDLPGAQGSWLFEGKAPEPSAGVVKLTESDLPGAQGSWLFEGKAEPPLPPPELLTIEQLRAESVTFKAPKTPPLSAVAGNPSPFEDPTFTTLQKDDPKPISTGIILADLGGGSYTVEFRGKQLTASSPAARTIAVGTEVTFVECGPTLWIIDADAGYPTRYARAIREFADAKPASTALWMLMRENPRRFTYQTGLSHGPAAGEDYKLDITTALDGHRQILPVEYAGASAPASSVSAGSTALCYNDPEKGWIVIGGEVVEEDMEVVVYCAEYFDLTPIVEYIPPNNVQVGWETGWALRLYAPNISDSTHYAQIEQPYVYPGPMDPGAFDPPVNQDYYAVDLLETYLPRCRPIPTPLNLPLDEAVTFTLPLLLKPTDLGPMPEFPTRTRVRTMFKRVGTKEFIEGYHVEFTYSLDADSTHIERTFDYPVQMLGESLVLEIGYLASGDFSLNPYGSSPYYGTADQISNITFSLTLRAPA
jgi:hypothetical protein